MAQRILVVSEKYLFSPNFSFPMSFSVTLSQLNTTEMLQGFSFGKDRVWDGQIDL